MASTTDWSELEQAFFASAPPDEPGLPAAAESFDDLGAPPAPESAWRAALRRRVVGAAAALRRLAIRTRT